MHVYENLLQMTAMIKITNTVIIAIVIIRFVAILQDISEAVRIKCEPKGNSIPTRHPP